MEKYGKKSESGMKEELLRFEHVVRKYAGRKVLDDFKLSLFCGEIVNLVGVRDYENDCFMELFSGQNMLAEGNFLFREKRIDLSKRPIQHSMGIVCIRKQSNLVPQMTVGENLFVIKANGRKFFLNTRAVRQQAHYLLEKNGLPISEDALAGSLRPAQCHLVEILRAMVQNASLIVMEDVAEAYSEAEKEQLRSLLSELAKQKIAVLYLSFYPGAVMPVSDRLLLMHRGQHIRTYYPENISEEMLMELVHQLNYGGSTPSINHSAGGIIFEIRGLCTSNMQHPFSLCLHQGEIVGMYDNGQQTGGEITDCIFKKRSWPEGSIRLAGEDLQPSLRRDELVKKGIVLIPDSMEETAYLHNLSPEENLLFPIMRRSSLPLFLKNQRMQRYVWDSFEKILDKYFHDDRIQGRYLENCIIYYRHILEKPYLMVCVNPYRCADTLMRKIIATFLRIAASQGISVLMISCEYKEMLLVCDQVIEMK